MQKKVSITSDIIIIAKLAIKSNNNIPFGRLYSVFNRFSASSLRKTIDSHLGKRSSDPKAFTYGDVFAFLFGNYLSDEDCIDLDFDHQFITADKKDAKYSYKKSNGYFQGIASVGSLIVGVVNRDDNTHVKFHQKDTLERIITRIEKQSKVVIRNFKADCGSFSSNILEYVKDHCEHFYSKA